MHLSIGQLPSYNLFTHHGNYLLWRDTTSELWTPVDSFTSDNTIYCKHCSFTFSTRHHFPNYTSNPLFLASSEIDNLTFKLEQSNLVVLCADSMSTGAVDTIRSTFFSYCFDNLGFILRENLLLRSSYLPLGGSQRTCALHASRLIF